MTTKRRAAPAVNNPKPVAHRTGSSVSATEAQNNFGRIMGQVRQEGHVFVTRYDTPEAVVMSIEEYDALTGRVPVALATLEREFDEMVERMQQPAQRAAVDALFAGRSASTSR